MTHITCRLTAKNRDQLRNPTLGNRVWATFRGKSGPALGGTEYPTDAISVPPDSASEIVKFTISIPRESCTNAKAKYSSGVVLPDPSVHFYHWLPLPFCAPHCYATVHVQQQCAYGVQLFVEATSFVVEGLCTQVQQLDHEILSHPQISHHGGVLPPQPAPPPSHGVNGWLMHRHIGRYRRSSRRKSTTYDKRDAVIRDAILTCAQKLALSRSEPRGDSGGSGWRKEAVKTGGRIHNVTERTPRKIFSTCSQRIQSCIKQHG